MKSFLVFIVIFFFSFSFSSEIAEIRKLYQSALIYLDEGKLDLAETNLISILRYPNQNRKAIRTFVSKAHYFLGEVYFIKEDFNKAIINYRIVLERFKEEEIYSKTLYKLGRTLIIADRLNEGIGVLEDFILNYPQNSELIPSSYYWLGRAYLKKGERNRAISYYKKILESYPNSYFAYEVRESLKTLSGMEENEGMISNIPFVTNKNILIEKEKKEKLEKEKELLKKIIALLEIKQELLELKMEYLNRIAREKEESLK